MPAERPGVGVGVVVMNTKRYAPKHHGRATARSKERCCAAAPPTASRARTPKQIVFESSVTRDGKSSRLSRAVLARK